MLYKIPCTSIYELNNGSIEMTVLEIVVIIPPTKRLILAILFSSQYVWVTGDFESRKKMYLLTLGFLCPTFNSKDIYSFLKQSF